MKSRHFISWGRSPRTWSLYLPMMITLASNINCKVMLNLAEIIKFTLYIHFENNSSSFELITYWMILRYSWNPELVTKM